MNCRQILVDGKHPAKGKAFALPREGRLAGEAKRHSSLTVRRIPCPSHSKICTLGC